VLAKRQAPRVHDLVDRALLAGEDVAPELLSVQIFAVEAHSEERPFRLPTDRSSLLAPVELLVQRLEQAIEAA